MNGVLAKRWPALLETQAQRAEGLESCWRRATNLLVRLQAWQSGANLDFVRWAETYSHSLQLNATPLVIAEIMQKQMSGHPRAWIFTSATLAVQDSFSHYCAEMGLGDADSARWESPFDYPRQALLYAPRNLPDPNHPNYAEAVVEAAFPVLKASAGRAFFLCTSLRAMRRTYELLSDWLQRDGLDLPLLLQGERSKNELLERFRHLGNAILIGSQSFWEGVDVRGEALSLVVIDKLPFAPPDDPVLSARIEKLRSEGRNPFMEYQLPRAVINVKQGAGRLIRDETDRGVLMICDPRLLSKPYGKRIWRSLPPMKRISRTRRRSGFLRPGSGRLIRMTTPLSRLLPISCRWTALRRLSCSIAAAPASRSIIDPCSARSKKVRERSRMPNCWRRDRICFRTAWFSSAPRISRAWRGSSPCSNGWWPCRRIANGCSPTRRRWRGIRPAPWGSIWVMTSTSVQTVRIDRSQYECRRRTAQCSLVARTACMLRSGGEDDTGADAGRGNLSGHVSRGVAAGSR